MEVCTTGVQSTYRRISLKKAVRRHTEATLFCVAITELRWSVYDP
jgi:hypothetical protein